MDNKSVIESEKGISEKRKKELHEIGRLLCAQVKNGITVVITQKAITIRPLSGEPVSFEGEDS